MNDPIIISPALVKVQHNKQRQHGNVGGKPMYIISTILIICSFFLSYYKNQFQYIDVYVRKNANSVTITSGILILLIIFVVLQLRRQRYHTTVQVIVLYPIGIQFGSIQITNDKHSISDYTKSKPLNTKSTNNSSKTIIRPDAFIHRDTIVDCIVTEVVQMHKVQTIVMLRIIVNENIPTYHRHQQQQVPMDDSVYNTRKNATKLLHLFSNIELSYIECLSIRSQVNKYLLERS